MNKLLVTGSSGLIGSEVVAYFCDQGWDVYGIDNNQRAIFFGPGVRLGIAQGVPGVSINDLTDPERLDVSGNAALSGVPVTVA